MMPIATRLAALAALVASSSLAAGSAVAAGSAPAAGSAAAAGVAFALPPMIVNVTAAPGVSPSLVSRILEETDAVWRGSGVTFVWRRAAPQVVPYSRAGEEGPYVPSTLRIVIGNDPGVVRGDKLPLGWIVFDDVTTPEQEIYVSYVNARQFIERARGVVGIVEQMTIVERETYLSRAMGRVLAHELGHYLLASKSHTPSGLMRAAHTARDLFAFDRGHFAIAPAERQQLAGRLRHEHRS
jgi:hypothetical protein